MKDNYEKLIGDEKNYQGKIEGLGNDLSMLKSQLGEKEKRVKECCQKIKKICRNLNFVAELKTVIDTMEANASSLTSLKTRQEADQMINNIKVLVNRLSAAA